MADLILTESGAVHRPRNVDWKRAAALLYGDWGTSKAYVIGLAFLAAGFSSLPIILAVCALTGLVGIDLHHFRRGGSDLDQIPARSHRPNHDRRALDHGVD